MGQINRMHTQLAAASFIQQNEDETSQRLETYFVSLFEELDEAEHRKDPLDQFLTFHSCLDEELCNH